MRHFVQNIKLPDQAEMQSILWRAIPAGTQIDKVCASVEQVMGGSCHHTITQPVVNSSSKVPFVIWQYSYGSATGYYLWSETTSSTAQKNF